jgi:head-tail adaptor
MISAGRLKWLATVQTPSTSQDALGMRVETWTSGASFRADLRNDSGNETSYADGVAVLKSYEVRARWQAVQGAGLTEVDRLSIRGKTLRVNAIRNLDEADRVAVIDCTEVV